MGPAPRLLLLTAMAVAAALPALGSRPAMACSCAGLRLEDEFKEADAVFEGRAIDVQQTSDQSPRVIATFEVLRAWKGVSETPVTAVTNSQGSACGYAFAPGERYTVYGQRVADAVDVDSCSRTHPGGPSTDEANLFGVPRAILDPNAPTLVSPIRPLEEQAQFESSGGSSAVLHLVLLLTPVILAPAIVVALVMWLRTRRPED